jgi:hypothetical protein
VPESEDVQQMKICRVLPDAKAAEGNLIRVIDDSGEDYLYPEKWFASIQLPAAARRAVNSR